MLDAHTIVRLQAESAENDGTEDFGGFVFVKDWVWRYHLCRRLLFSGYTSAANCVVVVCTHTRVKGHVLVLVIQFLFRLSRQGLSRPCIYFRLYHATGLYHAQGYITPMYNFRLYHAKGLYHAQGYITPRAISRPGGLYHARHTPTDYITSRAISRPCMFPRAISRPGLYHAHRGLYHIRG